MDELIKRITQNVLTHWGLTEYASGTVISTDPLNVQLNESIVLEPINLLKTSETPELNLEDKLIMLRVLRGQKYIILGKAVK